MRVCLQDSEQNASICDGSICNATLLSAGLSCCRSAALSCCRVLAIVQKLCMLNSLDLAARLLHVEQTVLLLLAATLHQGLK
jgi:hypothetical protein